MVAHVGVVALLALWILRVARMVAHVECLLALGHCMNLNTPPYV